MLICSRLRALFSSSCVLTCNKTRMAQNLSHGRAVQQMWVREKGSRKFQDYVRQVFASSENPYEVALTIMKCSPDHMGARNNSMSHIVMKVFKDWIASNCHNYPAPSTSLQSQVFSYVIRKNNGNMAKLAFSAFGLVHNKEKYLPDIKEFIFAKQYKEACWCAVGLELHAHFDINDFVVPLIFQDKLQVAEDFLSGSAQHQRQIVAFLDSLLVNSGLSDAVFRVAEQLCIPDVRYEKVANMKILKKLIARWAKQFGVDGDLCTNLQSKQKLSSLHYLVQKKYMEKDMSDANFNDTMEDLVADNVELQMELVSHISSYNDIALAARFARKFNLPVDQLPHCVQADLSGNHSNSQDTPQDEEKDRNKGQSFYKFTLPYSSITIVDTKEKYEDFLDHVGRAPLVGFDAEWKPSFFTSAKNDIGLMQFAIKDAVYLVDCVLLLEVLTSENWADLTEYVFKNPFSCKLGFGINNDFQTLSKSIPALGDVRHVSREILDLAPLSQWIMQQYPEMLQSVKGFSLSDLTEMCFGKPLHKEEQMSNWVKRPLRRDQILYAALDAYVLLEIYEELEKNAKVQNIDFQKMIGWAIKNRNKKGQPKPDARMEPSHQRNENPSVGSSGRAKRIQYPECLHPKNLRVVCDTMLQGLGRKLRRCGVDSVILANDADHYDCIDIAIKENRIILTRGHIYDSLVKHVPHGHCYSVISDEGTEQVSEVLHAFKVSVTKNDIFSRCQFCNCDDFIEISQSLMQRMHSNIVSTSSFGNTYSPQSSGRGWGHGSGASKNWNLFEESYANPERCRTKKGAKIQVASIPEGVLRTYKSFYVCDECGKCYWDGSHFDGIVHGKFKTIVA